MSQSYYEVLGVPRNADDKAIKKAFRTLANRYHPDRNKDDADAEAKFKEVNKAYEVLGDAEKRKLYDEFGEDAEQLGFDPQKARAYRQWRATGAPGGGSTGLDMDDILAQMFGGAFRAQRGPMRGRDARAALHIDFRTACRGGTTQLDLGGRSVSVRIPAGVRDGGTLRLRGQGPPGPHGGPAGDLLLTLSIEPDAQFTREDDDLRTHVTLTLATMLRGGTVEVPTLETPVRMRIPQGAQPGQVLRVRGKGLQISDREPGHLFVVLDLKLPDVAGKDLDAAIDALEAAYEPAKA